MAKKKTSKPKKSITQQKKELLEQAEIDEINQLAEDYPDTSDIMSTAERTRQNNLNSEKGKKTEVFIPKKSTQMRINPENIAELKKSFTDIDVEMIEREQLRFEKPPQQYQLFNIEYQIGSRFDKTYHAMLFDGNTSSKAVYFFAPSSLNTQLQKMISTGKNKAIAKYIEDKDSINFKRKKFKSFVVRY